MTEYVTPNIHSVLKKYQNSAPKSLQGPGHALAAAAAAAAANCLLDVGADVTGSAQSPTELAQLSNGGKCTAAQQTTPAVSLIKKEILSSPEPNEQNETVSTMSGTAAAAAAAAIVITTVPPPPPQIYPPPPPELSQPILSMADSGSGELYETRLEGKTIGCFSLGGEMRLCLPQFLNNVLADFTLEQINRIFDELGIYCSQCTPDQLNEFKAAKILPMDVKASGLITRTDAERLCAALLHRSDRNSYIPVESLPKGALSFHVYHKCFGKCEGICTPDMYSYQKPTCIKCLECDGWFSPQKFVGHVHRQFENRTCHWGFDSRNWHDYLHVALDVENREKYQRILDELKEVEIKETLKAQREFDYKKRKADIIVDDPMMPLSLSMGQPGLPPGLVPPPTHQALPASLKHRGELLDIPTKKHKASLDEATAYQLDIQRYQSLMYAHCVQQQRVGQMSAFRPWGPSKSFLHAYNASTVAALSTLPYLSQEPPVLQNPERVVRSTDRERFERTYQPNVALAPRKSILTKEREKEQRDRDRERERERERERIELEREREIERVRQRERSREREREKDRVQELQQQQQQQQQPQHLHLQQHVAAANLSESELHIKQERANTPVDMPQTPPPPPSSSNIDVLHNERHTSNGPIDEHTIGPIALSISQRETRHHNNNNNSHQNSMDVLQSRHHTALNTSNSASTCSSSTPPSAIGALSTPIKQKPMPAHLPHAPPNSQLQQQQQQQQHQRHLQHFPMHQSSPTPPHVATNSLSPEEFSGSSNEITSSTSPVPPSKNNNSSKNNSEHNNKQQNVIATVNQHSKLLPTSSNNNNNNNNTCGSGSNNSIHELPSRIRINRNLINTPNIMRTPTPPTLTPTAASQNAKNNFDYYKQQQQQQYNTQHQQQTSAAQQQQSQLNGSALYREQQPSPTQSSNTGLNLSINAASNAIPLSKQRQQAQPQTLNGTKPHLGSDFELSTDTDDDSLNGEPDSSNMLPPWEMAVEALRDTRPRDRERILHLLQRLLQENHQYRYNNMQLSEMLHKRDAHLIELREELQHCRCELERLLRVQQQNGDDNSTGSSGSGDSSKKTVKLVGNCQADELKEPFKNQLCGAVVDEDCDDEEEDEQKHSEMINGCAKIEPIVTDNKTNDAIRVATEQQQQQPNGVLRRSQTPSNCSNKKDIKRLKIEVEANGNSRESLHDDNSDTEEDTESVDITDNKHKITTGQQQQQQQESEQKSNGNIKSVEQTTAISRRSATGIDEANEIRYTATDASDESAGEETTADEDDMDIDDADEEHQFQQCAQAPHSNALATPPTATTPISPDSAATAGQLFDSSNSSDESSMKQAQMSASDALAKMTSEEAAEPEEEEEDDESVESDDDEENAEANADDDEDTDGDADEVPLQQRQLERQQRKTTTSSTPAAAIVTAGPTVKRRHSSNHDYHLKERTNYGNNCEKLCTTATSNATTMAAMSRTLTMPTKASKKQTPTTNCELQIKKEIV